MSRRVLMVCLVVYVLSAKGYIDVWDTRFSFQTSEAIVSNGHLDIPCFGRGFTLRGPDGRCYSKYGFGLPLYYVPFVAAGD